MRRTWSRVDIWRCMTTVAVLLLYVIGAAQVMLCGVATAADAAKTKLILGFERAEFSRGLPLSYEEKPGRDHWFFLLDRPEGFDFAARFEWPGAVNRAWTWRCRTGLHSEGKLALSATVGPTSRQSPGAAGPAFGDLS